MLPLAEAPGTDKDDQCAARPDRMLEPRLPGLARGKSVAIQKCAETRFLEARSQGLRRGRVRPR